MAKVLSDSGKWWGHPLTGITTQKPLSWYIVKLQENNVFYLQGLDTDFNAIYWVKSHVRARGFESITRTERFAVENLNGFYRWDDIIEIKTPTLVDF